MSMSAASSTAARRSRSPSIVFLVWAGLLMVSSGLERARQAGAAVSSPPRSRAALTRAPPWSSIGPAPTLIAVPLAPRATNGAAAVHPGFGAAVASSSGGLGVRLRPGGRRTVQPGQDAEATQASGFMLPPVGRRLPGRHDPPAASPLGSPEAQAVEVEHHPPIVLRPRWSTFRQDLEPAVARSPVFPMTHLPLAQGCSRDSANHTEPSRCLP